MKKIEKFIEKHSLITFAVVIIATILITRFIVYYIYDPDTKILGFDLHHFDYGLLLLIITILLMLFVGKYYKTYLITSAISLGLIIDQLWFIRNQIGGSNPAIYNPSFIPALIVAVFVIILAFIFQKLNRK